MRMPLAHIALLVWFFPVGASAAHANDIRTTLTRNDFAAETSARMMVLLTAASGQQALAQCMHDRYFGSPLLLRKTLWQVWGHPSDELAKAMLDVTTAACLKNPPDVSASERQTWLRTGNDTILLEPGRPTAEPAADMIAAYESMRGQDVAAQCAQDEGTRSKAKRHVSERLRIEPRVPVTLAVYNAYRTLCGLNTNGPSASEIVLPLMPDVPTVARERLQIVQDFAICQSTGGTDEDACVEQAYQKRSKGLFNQLLSSDSRN